ncbi:uncharacterized protein LOC133893316 isoform X1 [Phragmites australis]|uniref:uncharacterized protein LOC133893316 isoform X1 n=1 Tax=Phragmites australis TaxID=29695 RepID=UPI002D79E488|nr:uncharacterized protein LOC133893316 isoform X1 [Phragmites australis]
MALRYLARRAGIPALRRASGPHVSGRSRPLTPSTSQGGHSNGAGVGGTRKPVKDAGKVIDEDLARLEAEFKANIETIRKAIRDQRFGRRVMVGSGAAAVAFALFTTSDRKVRRII